MKLLRHIIIQFTRLAQGLLTLVGVPFCILLAMNANASYYGKVVFATFIVIATPIHFILKKLKFWKYKFWIEPI